MYLKYFDAIAKAIYTCIKFYFYFLTQYPTTLSNLHINYNNECVFSLPFPFFYLLKNCLIALAMISGIMHNRSVKRGYLCFSLNLGDRVFSSSLSNTKFP